MLEQVDLTGESDEEELDAPGASALAAELKAVRMN